MIREAVKADLPGIMQLVRKQHSESEMSFLKAEYSKLLSFFEHSFVSQEKLCLVAEREGVLVGFFAATINPYWFFKGKIAQELSVFVEKSHRGSSLGFRLIKGFLVWAEKQKATEAIAGTVMLSSTSAAKRIYEGAGFDTVGYLFKKRI